MAPAACGRRGGGRARAARRRAHPAGSGGRRLARGRRQAGTRRRAPGARVAARARAVAGDVGARAVGRRPRWFEAAARRLRRRVVVAARPVRRRHPRPRRGRAGAGRAAALVNGKAGARARRALVAGRVPHRLPRGRHAARRRRRRDGRSPARPAGRRRGGGVVAARRAQGRLRRRARARVDGPSRLPQSRVAVGARGERHRAGLVLRRDTAAR